jgi:hypothetical protein
MAETVLECPECGLGGRTPDAPSRAFRYVAEVTSLRWIAGFGQGGELRVEAQEQIAYDEGLHAQRIQCGRCFAEFALPSGTKVEFTC